MAETYTKGERGEYQITSTVTSERVETITLEEIDADIATYTALLEGLQAKRANCLKAK
ncbi:MAG: hypothetical protein NUV65_03120 [Candidatus Roizmanbacteria bacterium]|nr:hypothetical protein [Candidatus Roizmanbacteria bacterium]